jgi:hypothetical protein
MTSASRSKATAMATAQAKTRATMAATSERMTRAVAEEDETQTWEMGMRTTT